MADNKKVYENNTLAGVAGNFANQAKSDWQNIAQNEWPEVKERLGNVATTVKDAGNAYLDLNKKLYVDMPIQGAKTVGNFLFGSPEKVQTDEDRLHEYVGKGYTTKNGDDYLYSPEGVRSNIKYDGSIGNSGLPETAQSLGTGRRLNLNVNDERAGGVIPDTTPGVTGNAIDESAAQTLGIGAKGGSTASGGFNGGVTATNQRQLKNADVNFSQYGDDSSAPNQATAGGMNEKYTGEFTKNSNLGYDPNITTADLDPNYLFGMDAQRANTDSAGYIARRNDMIASALYNEGRTSKQDVIDFLASQKGWMNSTEADRANTIESIWKRLGGMVNENEIKDAAVADLNKSTGVSSDPTVNAMEADLNKDNSTVIYGKVGTDEDASVKTLEDENSVYRVMNESRIQQYKQINSMDSQAIAAAVISGGISEDGQQMRDLQQYNPDKYQYVMQALKQIRGQQNINSIANGTYDYSTTIGSSSKSEIQSFAIDNATSSTSAADILSSVNSTLSSNQEAKSAQETMDGIERDMAKLKNRLKNLKSEAKSVFKGDVPQYIVNAYIANRTAEIQNEMGMLEDRYNAAYSRYQSERERVKWEKEFDLKKEELDIKKSNAAWDKYMDEQGLALKYADATGNTASLNRNLMRTERNNNPTAMTTDVAKSLGLVEGIDYTIGDPFQSGSGTLYTAKLLGDPIETTIKALDTAATTGRGAFYTKGGKQRWTHTAMSDADWMGLSNEEKRDVVLSMLKREGGDINKMAAYGGGTTGTTGAAGQQGGNWTRRDGEVFNLDNAPTYNGLSYDQQNTVKGLLNLSINPATITKRQYGDDFEKILSAVTEINPNWQSADYGQADKVKKEWNTSTKNGSNSRNGTAIATAKELYEMADTLGNAKFTDWNSMMNYFKKKLSNEDFIRFRVKLGTLASEYAGALKGNNAAPTEKEIEEARQQISENLSGGGIRAAAIEMTKSLYNKNANEADNYRNVTLEKPNLIVTEDVADWMYDVAGITSLPEYYKYNPQGGWSVFSQSNNPSNDDMIYNIFSY